jgi:hypothetical protein
MPNSSGTRGQRALSPERYPLARMAALSLSFFQAGLRMSGNGPVPALQVEADSGFERGWHGFEIVCWLVMAAVVLGALAGVLGDGPLAGRTRSFPGGTLRYERFGHYMAPSRLAFSFGAPREAIAVHIDDAILARIDITGIEPRPLSAVQSGDGVTYRFAAENAARGLIQFRLQPHKVGPTEGTVAFDGTPLRLALFVLP